MKYWLMKYWLMKYWLMKYWLADMRRGSERWKLMLTEKFRSCFGRKRRLSASAMYLVSTGPSAGGLGWRCVDRHPRRRRRKMKNHLKKARK